MDRYKNGAIISTFKTVYERQSTYHYVFVGAGAFDNQSAKSRAVCQVCNGFNSVFVARNRNERSKGCCIIVGDDVDG